MPYKSDAQRKKFHALEAEGKISSKTVKKYKELGTEYKTKNIEAKFARCKEIGALK